MERNVDVVRRGYEHFIATGDLRVDIVAPEFVWDMSHFSGWPEEQIYHGFQGMLAFLRSWAGAWDGWELEVETLHEAGDQVLAITRQSGQSKATGLRVEMTFAMLWTLRDGLQTRMDMYSDTAEAMRAVGLVEPGSAGNREV
jgi:ketosteroid isomerase-like protein